MTWIRECYYTILRILYGWDSFTVKRENKTFKAVGIVSALECLAAVAAHGWIELLWGAPPLSRSMIAAMAAAAVGTNLGVVARQDWKTFEGRFANYAPDRRRLMTNIGTTVLVVVILFVGISGYVRRKGGWSR